MTVPATIAHSGLHRAAALMLVGHIWSVLPATCRGDDRAGLPQVRSRLEHGKRVAIACLGDSVTGVYFHTGGRQAYPEMLAAALRSAYPCAEVEVINGGVSGHTSLDGIARLRSDILPRRPHLVTIMFGLNDMVLVDLAKFEATLALMVDECREGGAEAILCTPNAVEDTSSRPRARLVEYVTAIRSVGRTKGAPVADVFAAHENLRRCDPAEFTLLMSDPFHPNADGHKLTSRVICDTLGVEGSAYLKTRPPSPPVRRLAGLLEAHREVHVLATPPCDDLIARTLRRVRPDALLKVTSWQTAGKSLPELALDVRGVRGLQPDLVVFATSSKHCQGSIEQFARSYREILNGLLSFERREWDVLALPPSICERSMNCQQMQFDALARRLIHAQDLPLIVRTPEDPRSPFDLLTDWLREHLNMAGRS